MCSAGARAADGGLLQSCLVEVARDAARERRLVGHNRAMAADARLPLGPELERGPELEVFVEGKPVRAFAGETVAAVLFAEEIVTTRTTRMRSPRGVFCGMGVCFDCLVVVDGVANERACMTWVAEGMRIELQDGLGPIPAASPAPSRQ